MEVEHHLSPWAEHRGNIQITNKPYKYSALFSLPISNVKEGEIIQAHCQFQVTNPYPFNVMVAHTMIIGRNFLKDKLYNNKTFPKKDNGDWLFDLAPKAGENVTEGMHHGFRNIVGSIESSKKNGVIGDIYITVVIYSASTAVRSEYLTVIEGDLPKEVVDAYSEVPKSITKTKDVPCITQMEDIASEPKTETDIIAANSYLLTVHKGYGGLSALVFRNS